MWTFFDNIFYVKECPYCSKGHGLKRRSQNLVDLRLHWSYAMWLTAIGWPGVTLKVDIKGV